MLALISGIKSSTTLSYIIHCTMKTSFTSLSNIIFFFGTNRWPYPFLDLSSSYAPLWY